MVLDVVVVIALATAFLSLQCTRVLCITTKHVYNTVSMCSYHLVDTTPCMCIALLLACVVEVLSLHVLMLLVCVLCMYSSKYYNMYVHCITTSMCSDVLP